MKYSNLVFFWCLSALAGDHYSRLNQINKSNVSKLQLAWKYDSGDEFQGSEMQCEPLVIDGVLYATTPKLRIIALNAATGKLIWSFDPWNGAPVKQKQRNRGLTYANGRLFVAAKNDLMAIDAKTGKLIPSFGTEGKVDLRAGLGRPVDTLSVGSTSPGVVYKDLLILGSITSEDLPSAPGFIRAYDVRTGAIRWTFKTIPGPGEFGYDTWPKDAWKHTGGANSWPGLALDEKRGIVYVPTGSAAFDFYGADRAGDNLFANCLIALKADSGKRVWHFQFVHHDVWDRDLPSAPALVQVQRNGKKIDAVAQITKSGFVFVFDRDTGKSLFPLQERDVPASDVEGEVLAKKQTLPLAPAPFARQKLTEDMLTNRTPEAHAAALERFRQIRSGDQFTPPSLQGTVVFPGFDGGGEWGGPAFDPETGLFYVNSNEMAWILRLVPRQAKGPATSAGLYQQYCASCHRADRKGNPPEFPSLVDIGSRWSRDQIRNVIRKGAGRMPAFANLSDPVVDAIVAYAASGEEKEVVVSQGGGAPSLKYRMDGYNKFLDADGYPAIAPPWGTLNAINLNTGEYAWKIPFGEFPELQDKTTGTENYGGGVVTAGGLLFIGATNHDRKFRVFDKVTGKVLWETELNASANSSAVVYEVNGQQFVAVGAGGGKSGAKSGGSYYAFALPQPPPGVVIDHESQASRQYIGSPSIVILRDGSYIASHDFFGPGSKYREAAQSRVFRSTDKGKTWSLLAELDGQFWSTLFTHQGRLYLIGTHKEYGDVILRQSTDGGKTWTRSVLLEGRYHCAPQPVIVHDGRIWRAMEDADGGGGWGKHFRAFMMSAPVDADLMKPESWTASNRIGRDASWLGGEFGGWLEGNAVVAPQGHVVNILRVDYFNGGKAAMMQISKDGKTASFDPANGFIDLPGGATKFTIRYDPKSKLYWSLVNHVLPEYTSIKAASVRNTVTLVSSPDLRNWTVRKTILHHADTEKHGMQYIDWQFDGDDLIAAIRTAWDDDTGGAHNFHDANFLVFYRIPKFRSISGS